MGALIREVDWSATPLGKAEDWPQSLRSAASICLGSGFSIAVYWGSELVLLYNDAWSSIPGAKHPWAVGRPAREVWPEIWDTIGPLFQHVLETGEATRSKDQLLAMRRHGYVEECYFDYTFSPVWGESGRVEGIFNAVLETTERVVGERRLGTIRKLAEQVVEARTVELACEMTARTLAEASVDIPFALFYLVSSDGSELVLSGSSGLASGTPASPLSIALGTHGEPSPVWPVEQVIASGSAQLIENLDSSIGPLPGGPWPESPSSALVLPVLRGSSERPYGVLIAGISPRRALDTDYTAFLNLATNHIAQALGNAEGYEKERKRADALAEIDRAKTAFFSNVSHEFRTPLTLMLGPLEEMLGMTGQLPPRMAEMVSVTHRNGLRLQKLVNTLLDFSRIEAGRAQASYEPTDLAAFTAELASTFRSTLEKAGLELNVDCRALPQPVYVDREMWEKVVLNLLSNAFKYTAAGRISVRLEAGEGHALLSVEDTGTGIPENELPHIFERFYRVEGARGRTQEGTGIGLALVAELVRLHGGTITVRSTIGQGSAFTVSLLFGAAHLPGMHIGAARVRASGGLGHKSLHTVSYVDEAGHWSLGERDYKSEASRESAIQEPRPTILLADDNADMRDYVARLLNDRYEVETVANGEEALARILHAPPDLVLTDVMMPRLDGFGLLEAIRSRPGTNTLPVILLSARVGEEARIGGLDAGATDYLVKPFTARELRARVRVHLEMALLRKQAAGREASLLTEAKESRDTALSVLESITDGLFTLDLNWCFTYVNRAAEGMIGAGREELLGKNFWATYPSVLGSALEVEYRRAFQDRITTEVEHLYTPWGRWFASKVYPAGEGGLSIYFRDITIQKEAEAQLRKSQEQLRQQWHTFDNVVSTTPDALYTFDLEGRFTYANRALLARLHLSFEEIIGKNLREAHYPPDVATHVEKQIQEVIQTGNALRDQLSVTLPDAEERHYDYILTPLFGADKKTVEAVAGSTRDITERKEAEEQERQIQARIRDSARLESLGVMASGIAHDFNNLLVGILGSATLLAETTGESNRSTVDLIILAGERAAELTRQMLAYSGKGHFVKEVLDLNRLIYENLTLLRSTISRNISVAVETAREACFAEVDRAQIHQVVMNLLLNASEAIGNNPGNVSIRTAIIERSESTYSAHLHAPVPAGRYVLLEIHDSGAGMPPETLARIFDPFFTTKFIGRGLGLAAVLGIVKGHHGDIEVESVPGSGTTFHVILPVAEPISLPKGDPDSIQLDKERYQTVLVIDDEEIVRMTAAAALQKGGFRVLLASDGAEGLELLESNTNISLAILDLTMPFMTGEQTLPLIRAMRPDLPIIISSGFSEAEVSRRFADSNIAGVLQKPYSVSTIISKASAALNAYRISQMGEPDGDAGTEPFRSSEVSTRPS